jgi:hypothetical protein
VAGERAATTMMQFTRRASLGVVLLLLASVGTASAECTCVSLRTFTSEERGRFEEQYGIEWWKVIDLIPAVSGMTLAVRFLASRLWCASWRSG